MRISTEIELEAAKDVFDKYSFRPGSSRRHPLQASLSLLAKAVEDYERKFAFSHGR